MLKNIDGTHNDKVMHKDHLVFAVILFVVTAFVFLFICQKVLKIVEDGCFNRLREYAEVASNEFIMNNLHYGGALQFVADALGDRGDYSVDSLQPKLGAAQAERDAAVFARPENQHSLAGRYGDFARWRGNEFLENEVVL